MTPSQRRLWVGWLHGGCALPLGHVAAVLAVELADVEHDWAIRQRRIVADPTEAPGARNPARPILAQTGAKIRSLHRLGYRPERIGQILALEVGRVRDFLRRSKRRRPRGDRPVDADLVRPRQRDEQRAADVARKRAHDRQRRRRRNTPPLEWAWSGRRDAVASEAAEWARLRDAIKTGALATSEILTLADRLAVGAHAVPAIALPPPSPWVGSAALTGGQCKLSAADVREIRELRGAGWTTGRLAQRFGVTRATICYALSGHTWAHV